MATFEYKEIYKLRDMLLENNIPFEEFSRNNGLQIMYPNQKFVCSAIEFDGSRDCEYDKIEIMGLVSKDEGKDYMLEWLSAEEVFKRIESHWKRQTDDL